MLCQLSYAPQRLEGKDCTRRPAGIAPRMSEYEQGQQQDPVESGALEDPGGEGGQAQSTDEPAESGALEDEQQGKGYGADEGERDQTLSADDASRAAEPPSGDV